MAGGRLVCGVVVDASSLELEVGRGVVNNDLEVILQ